MASNGQLQSPPIPTAVHLHEPEFQPSPTDQKAPQHGTLPTATDFAPSHPVADDTGSRHAAHTTAPSSAAAPSAEHAEEETSRPSMHKFVTERAKPAVKTHQELKRAGTAQDMTRHMHRPETLTFDPYDSDCDSSSDSDQDEPARTQPGRASDKNGTTSNSDPSSKIRFGNDQFHTKGKVSKKDGRLKLSISETLNSGYFAKTLGAGLKKHFTGADDIQDDHQSSTHAKIAPDDDAMEDPKRRIRLNVVIIVIGSRGDIQPFLRIGKILKEDYGHRVRIATHPAFKSFIENDIGLEFFSIGGDPSELMAFMVKNPGLIPNLETVKEGEIGKRRAAMYEMFEGMWRACINATDDENDHANLKMSTFPECESCDTTPDQCTVDQCDPFICDAIIANPPSFAPPHIAERLGVPLHMMFT